MLYVVDYREPNGDFDSMAKPFDTPEEAARGFFLWLYNEGVVDADDEVQQAIDAHPDAHACFDVRVAAQDGSVYDAECSVYLVDVVMSRPKGRRSLWRVEVDSCKRVEGLRCRFHYFTAEELEEFGGEPGWYMAHFCVCDPCAECTELGEEKPS